MKTQKGQTLIEILIALGIAAILVTSMTVAVVSALDDSTYSKNQNIATQYAQEGMEIVRQLRGGNYQQFSSLSGRYCIAQNCSTINTSVGSCGLNSGGQNVNCSVNVGNYIRQVDIAQNDASCSNTTKATVSVLWTDGKCANNTYCHNENIISCFSSADVLQTP